MGRVLVLTGFKTCMKSFVKGLYNYRSASFLAKSLPSGGFVHKGRLPRGGGAWANVDMIRGANNLEDVSN